MAKASTLNGPTLPGSFPISDLLCLPQLLHSSAINETESEIAEVDEILQRIQRARDEVLPTRLHNTKEDIRKRQQTRAEVQPSIRSVKRTAETHPTAAHVYQKSKELSQKITTALQPQPSGMAEIQAQEAQLTTILGKLREQKKQLKRLLNLQNVYVTQGWMAGVDDDERLALQRKMQVAWERADRAADVNCQTLKGWNEVVERVNGVAEDLMAGWRASNEKEPGTARAPFEASRNPGC